MAAGDFVGSHRPQVQIQLHVMHWHEDILFFFVQGKIVSIRDDQVYHDCSVCQLLIRQLTTQGVSDVSHTNTNVNSCDPTLMPDRVGSRKLFFSDCLD
jgi:hypothetical protein